MNLFRYIIAICIVPFSVTEVSAQMDIRVRLGNEPNNIMVSIKEGHYTILAAEFNGFAIDTVWDIMDSDPIKLLHIKQQGDKLALSSKALGTVVLSELWLVPSKDDIDPSFIISGVGKNERWYQDVLHVYVSKPQNKLTVVNQVHFEKYVAGVVESEGGAFPELEFFKAQAVIARTFAMKNLKKHISEGYNLRDDVSSQVYHSRAYLKNSTMIMEATKATSDSILVDKFGFPLSTLFHANSGGQTANAGDVWSNDIPYLRSRPDPFSVNQASFRWEKSINKHELLSFLARQLNTDSQDSGLINAWENFSQPSRKAFFTYNDKRIKLTQIRHRFNLRSTFFDVHQSGQNYILKGRGYGHGVGLSQDGAIQMSNSGFSFKDILYFYYENSELVNLKELFNRREEIRELVNKNSRNPMFRDSPGT